MDNTPAIPVLSDCLMPTYMEPDSYGPVVFALLDFLNAWARKERPDLHPATRNGIFGGQATRLMIAYQKARGLDMDGGCGPLTRARMAGKDGFGLENGAMDIKEMYDGITAFVQLDGSTLYWAPYIGIRSDRGLIEMMFRMSRHGN